MQKAIRWIVWGALFIIPFLPLVVLNNFFFPFITGKNFAFRILVEIALVGWLVLALVDKKYRPRWSWVLVIYAAFAVWMAIANVFAENPYKAFWSNFERMDGWITLIHLFAFFLVAGTMLAADKLWRKWWYAFLGGSLLVCLYAILQVAGFLAIHQGGVRVDATFGNAEYLAGYLLFTIAISLWLAFEERNRWLKYALIALTVLELVVLYYTATRGAILGLVGAAIFGALLWMFEAGKNGRRYAAATLIILVILSGGFFLIRNSKLVQSDPTLARIGSISLSDGATRFTIWHMALEGFAARPITGWGQEGFNYVFNRYYEPSLYAQEAWFDRAHDVFLDWLVAGGAPALLLFLALLAATTIALYRSDVSRTERILFIAALAAYAFQGLFVFDNLFTYVPLAAIIAMAHGSSSKPIKQFENKAPITPAQFETMALPIAAVALIVVIWFVDVPGVRASTDLINALTEQSDVSANLADFKQAFADNSFGNQEIAEQLMTFAETTVSNQAVSNSDKEAVFSYAVQQMQMEAQKIPNDARIHMEFALGLRAGGDIPDALMQIHLAEQQSPKKQGIIDEEGVEDWLGGNLPAAQTAFDKAYELDTSYQLAAAYAAAGDIINGQLPQGKALLQQSFGTTTVDQDAVLLAYYQVKDYPDFLDVWRLRVIDNSDNAESEFGLGAALADAGQFDAAKAQIEATIQANPSQASEGEAMLQQLAAMEASSTP